LADTSSNCFVFQLCSKIAQNVGPLWNTGTAMYFIRLIIRLRRSQRINYENCEK